MRRQTPPRAGYTLVELVVACVVFALGVLALQRAMLLVLTQTRDARLQEIAVDLAAGQLERMANTACASVVDGSAAARGVQMRWTAGDLLRPEVRTVTQRSTYRRSTGTREDIYMGAARCR